jgi:hypothetical protein
VSEPSNSGRSLTLSRLLLGGLALLAVGSVISACNSEGTSPEATDPPSTAFAPVFESASPTPDVATPSVSATFAATADTPSPIATTPASDTPAPATTPPPAQSTRTPGIAYPDPILTPGAVFAVTAGNVCVSGYSSKVRSVSTAEKSQVYAEYHTDKGKTGDHEVDHLVPLELGGSNDIKNLWPEPANPKPGFHEKDTLENTMHALVCSGKLDLAEAQREIAGDWYAAYQRYVLQL